MIGWVSHPHTPSDPATKEYVDGKSAFVFEEFNKTTFTTSLKTKTINMPVIGSDSGKKVPCGIRYILHLNKFKSSDQQILTIQFNASDTSSSDLIYRVFSCPRDRALTYNASFFDFSISTVLGNDDLYVATGYYIYGVYRLLNFDGSTIAINASKITSGSVNLSLSWIYGE